jgi:hypothetical protein
MDLAWYWAKDPRLEENLAMGEPEQPPGSSGEKPHQDPGAEEAALMQEILRRQEQHREGGVEPELDETNEDPRPGA